MAYDKNSFLSGVAVGRQLKGWGRALADEGKPRNDLTITVVPQVVLSITANSALAETPTATLEVE